MARQANNKPGGGEGPRGGVTTPRVDEITQGTETPIPQGTDATSETRGGPGTQTPEAPAITPERGKTETANAGQDGTTPPDTGGTDTQEPGGGEGPRGGDKDGGEEGSADDGPPETAGKCKVKNPDEKGKKLYVGARLVQFDADGVVELEAAEAKVLLGIKGYEAVK